jgi:hypothetical protein
VYTSVATMTPQEAAEILSTKNFSNRPISQSVVDKYAQEMKRGRWKLSGEAIIFAKSGRLLDGQHRLLACVQGNVLFETVVVKGAEDHVFDVIDDGKTRTMGDVLSIHGHVNASYLAAGLRFIWDYASGTFRSKGKGAVIPTKQLLGKLLDRHLGIKNSVKLYSLLKGRMGGILLPPSLCIGLHYLFSLINAEQADAFFTSLQSGLNLVEGHPIAVLRARLIGDEKRGGARKIRQEAQYTYTVKAWNAFLVDKKIKPQYLFFDEGKPMPEIEDLPAGMMRDLL